jgi:3-phenylpropionate/trans-cinnamate dioxygenase ferredoxin subunit
MDDVCALSDLSHGKAYPVRVAGRGLVLVRWEDEVFALRNTCPHQGRALADGPVRPRLAVSARSAMFDEVEVQADRPMIVCPWHGWLYDLSSGRCQTDPEIRVRAYRTEIVDGRVLIDVSRSGNRSSGATQ